MSQPIPPDREALETEVRAPLDACGHCLALYGFLDGDPAPES